MPDAPTFQRAVRHAVKARIALAGPSGSGKTYTALTLATALANGGGTAVVDTEEGSASLYADEFDFSTLEFRPPFSPSRYVEAITAAEEAGFTVLVVDSISHAWAGEGGVLDLVDQAKARKRNQMDAWRDVGTPEQNKLIERLIRCQLHLIVTMRSKVAYEVGEKDGRTTVTKLGMAPIQREGVDYEFHVFGDLDLDHTLRISKSRYRALQDLVVRKPGRDFAKKIIGEISQDSGAVAVGDPAVSGSAPLPSEPERATVPELDGGGVESSRGEGHSAPPTEPGVAGEAATERAQPPATPEQGSLDEPPMEGPPTKDQLDRAKQVYKSGVKLLQAARAKWPERKIGALDDLTAEDVKQLVMAVTH